MSQPPLEETPDDGLPGMWEWADLIGGETDADMVWQGPFIAAALGKERIRLEHTRKGPHWAAHPKEERDEQGLPPVLPGVSAEQAPELRRDHLEPGH